MSKYKGKFMLIIIYKTYVDGDLNNLKRRAI